ncbi:hypothetical protein HYZ99_04660 [Candidatus Peregrinibacteria bacterium]|nr:hypothetical protein [Candidatus Peregrinibacteria bacterium]
MKNEPRGNARGRRHGDGYDAETLYQFYKEAGGNVAEAMRLSEHDRRVPRDKHTWSDCIERMGYRERYRKETDQEWREFGQERQRIRQHNMDIVAETFEQFVATYTGMLRQAMKAIQSKGDQAGLLLLRKDFAFGIEQYDRFFRMYLRAMGMPEHITSNGKPERPTTILTLSPEQKEKLNEYHFRSLGWKGEIPPPPKNAREAKEIGRKMTLLRQQRDHPHSPPLTPVSRVCGA